MYVDINVQIYKIVQKYIFYSHPDFLKIITTHTTDIFHNIIYV